ncbi:MAG: hypothetical protein K8R23_01270 [Chthoniobacter sp.]|nr:hypothetical protein [Chthoniobacter sp.]
MDVHCTTCGEPWDTYHLWHDAIWDTGLSEAEIRAWEKLPQSGKLAPKWRQQFEAACYVFGRTVINVIRCPACPKDAQPDRAKVQINAEIENLLAGDEDGLAATYEDHGL